MSRGCVDGEVDYAVIGYLVGLVFDLMYHPFFSWSWIEGMDDGMTGRGKKEKKKKREKERKREREEESSACRLGPRGANLILTSYRCRDHAIGCDTVLFCC